MISVVIPVRNRAELVKRTLDSLAAQTRSPEAIILVDNGSTDNTLEVLTRWAAGRENVRVVSEPQPGAARARNKGLDLVETPYVMFFDSDDVMPPRHIEDVCAGLGEAGMPQIGYYSRVLIDINGVDRRRRNAPAPERLMYGHIFHSLLATQAYVVRTEFIRACGGWDNSLGGWDDWELGVRLLAARPTLSRIRLTAPVEVYCQAESITGTDFSSKAGQWERALDASQRALSGTRSEGLIDYRRAILAGHYIKEGRPDLATPLARTWKFRMIARYVAAGGRGVARIARLIG